MARTSAADRAAARSEPSTPDRKLTTISPGTAAGPAEPAVCNVGPLCAAAFVVIPGSTHTAAIAAIVAAARIAVARTHRAWIRMLIGVSPLLMCRAGHHHPLTFR